MPGKMPTASNARSVSRPALGPSKARKKDKFSPNEPSGVPRQVSTGSVSKPQSATAKARFKAQPAPRQVGTVI